MRSFPSGGAVCCNRYRTAQRESPDRTAPSTLRASPQCRALHAPAQASYDRGRPHLRIVARGMVQERIAVAPVVTARRRNVPRHRIPDKVRDLGPIVSEETDGPRVGRFARLEPGADERAGTVAVGRARWTRSSRVQADPRALPAFTESRRRQGERAYRDAIHHRISQESTQVEPNNSPIGLAPVFTIRIGRPPGVRIWRS